MTVPVLLITGPVGVGKTSVMTAVTELLEARQVAHAAVNMDALSEYFPRPATDPFGSEVALNNLAAVWQNYRDAGAGRLILAGVIESRDDLARFREAIPGAEITVCRLRAPITILQERVRRRELGSGLQWHLKRAAELAVRFEHTPVEDFTVDTESRGLHEIAQEVLARSGW